MSYIAPVKDMLFVLKELAGINFKNARPAANLTATHG
ncbi:acyl-CoA dehydrogenase N-terminal domain-containing protein [Burkholderia ubonensis]|nr:acyl-CoA dehydrogenase N-terminal domain-containing protein [Burkholderia ubonensis]